LTSAEAYAAKLNQKEAKERLEREKQLCLEKKKNKMKHNKENAKKSSSSKKNSNVIQNDAVDAADTQDTSTCMYCEIQFCQSTVDWVKCKVCEQWACSQCAHLGRKRKFVCDSCK